MFGWSVTFLIVAIVAGIFGFSGIAGTVAAIAKILFAVGLLVFLALVVSARNALSRPLPGSAPPEPSRARTSSIRDKICQQKQ